MKNQAVYEQYAIEGWPCHFYTISAVDKFNGKIEKYCNKLPEDSKDLTSSQLFRLRIYARYLDVYDAIKSARERT